MSVAVIGIVQATPFYPACGTVFAIRTEGVKKTMLSKDMGFGQIMKCRQ
jgi:hypothetical protein